MKKHLPIFFFAAFFLSVFFSCTKINEATDLGGDLVPAVDNVNTFQTTFDAVTNNLLYNDTTKVNFGDLLAAGDLDDPEFGSRHADFYFNILPSVLGVYPFKSKDSIVVMDSVVLSLSYARGYGDTSSGMQTLRVYEIDLGSDFNDTTLYRYSDPTTQFATGSELGSKTFSVSSIKDSIPIIRGGDTTKVARVVRIKLSNSLASKFAQFDTTRGPMGGYYKDTAQNVVPGKKFRSLFKGLAVKADNGGNVLSYFNINDYAKSRLTVYFKVMHPATGKNDTLSFDFYHTTNGQANYVKTTRAGSWEAYLTNGSNNDDKVYLQSSPSGSYAAVTIPGLSSFKNKVVHRAELIVPRLASAGADVFTPPVQLFLDRTNSFTPDTAFALYKDLGISINGSLDLSLFGGRQKNGAYIFNVTRYVQSIATSQTPNDTLRLYAPLRTTLYAENVKQYITVPVAPAIALGRVVLGGGNYAIPDQRMRLRIVYSNL